MMKSALAAIAMILGSCDLLEPFISMTPLTVTSFSPEADFVDPASLEALSITFSAEMNRASAERAFSLLEDGTRLSGTFSWDGSRLAFNPEHGFFPGKTYEVTVTTAAEDSLGNSLGHDLRFRFFTGAEAVPPSVVSHIPARGAVIADPLAPLSISFSEAIDQASFISALRLIPDVPGVLSWNSDSTTVTLTPLSPLRFATIYTLTLGTALRDRGGAALAQEYGFSFRTENPIELRPVRVSQGTTALVDDSVLVLNTGVEKDAVLTVVFNRPVRPDERSGAWSLAPGIETSSLWNAGGTEVRISFSKPAPWNQVYRLTAGTLSYQFRIDGPGSRPPEAVALYYTPDFTAASPVFTPVLAGGVLSLGGDPPPAPCFDLYIRKSPLPSITVILASVAAAVDVAVTNAAADIEITGLHRPAAGAVLARPPAADEEVFRLTADIVNELASGVLTLTLRRGVGDTNSNTSTADAVFSVNKIP